MKTANEYLSREALISKLEAAQQQLAEKADCLSTIKWELDKSISENTALRKQLAASIELCNIREEQIGELLKESEASQAEVERLRGMLLIMENGCPLCGDNQVQYLPHHNVLDVWCSACESNYAGMMLDRI